MGRPRKFRRIRFRPRSNYFKPRGIPMHALEEVVLEKDEMEAVRLCDLDGKNMMLAAKEMEVSKSTIHRLLAVAHRKMADGLINGKALYVGQEDNFH